MEIKKPDLTKLGWFDRTIESCIVSSIPAGDVPKFIKVKLPGPDEPIIDAWWTGIPDLEEDQSVSIRRSDGNQAQYSISGGGSGTAPPSPHTHPATDITADTTNFDNNLSAADDTVQKALETLNDMSSGSWPFFNVIHATSDAELTAAVAAATAGQTTIVIDCDIQLTDDIEINKAISIVGFPGGYSVPTIKGPVAGGRCFSVSGTNDAFVSFSGLTMETTETDILFATNSSIFLENCTLRFVGPVTGDVGGLVALVTSGRSEDIQIKVFNSRFLNVDPGDSFGYGLWLVNTDTGYGPDALTVEVHHSAFAVVSSDIEAEECTIRLYDPVLPNGVNETGCVITGSWMDSNGNRLPASVISSLAAADGSPNPAWEVDNAGNLSNPGGGVLDLNGTADALVLDADADTSISAPTDDQIDFEAGGVDIARITAAGLTLPQTTTDAYIAGDEAGIKERVVNAYQTSITDHFDSGSFSGWTWAAYSGFVTPANIDMATHPSFVLIYNSSGQGAARAFAYQGSASDSIHAKVGVVIDTRIGVRLDDGTNSNYFELFVERGNSASSPTIRYRYANAGVVTGPTTVFTPTLVSLITLHIGKGANITAYYIMDTPRRISTFSIASWFTTARSGIYYELVSGTPGPDRSAFVDWYKQT